MLRGQRRTGLARHPGHEGNNGRPIQHAGVGRRVDIGQAWPHDIAARPPAAPAENNVIMSVRGGARRQTRPIYHLPPVAPPATNRYAPAATIAAPINPAVMHGQGAVNNLNRQMYPMATTAAAAGGYRVSPREAALAAELLDVRGKARNEYAYAMRRIRESEAEGLAHRQRAEEAERNLRLVENELQHEKMASDALTVIAREKTDLLAAEEGRSKVLKRLVDNLLKEKADSDGWANEPVRGNEALAILLPDGVEAGPPRQAEMQDRCSPGLVRQVFLGQKQSDCACKRELAVNGLTSPRNRYEDIAILGEGGFGTVFRGKCRKTKKTYAIKRVKPGNPGACLLREMMAYVIIKSHTNIISVECLSDLAGSEGLVMEIAVCDLFQASRGTSDTVFTVAQQLSFEADATEGLQYMHGLGLVHCDVKLENTLICRSGGPSGFVAKVTDPGLWCGLGETRMIETGTLGWTPLENVLGEVEASPDQDAFSVGVDMLFILACPQLKTDVVNMWAHKMLMTDVELERLNVLQAEGGCQNQLRAEVTERTMSDGSLVRILLQAENFNSALPLSERVKTCEALAKTLSRSPLDRHNMPELTTLLRHLAREAAAREKMLAAVPPVFSLRPGNALPPGLAPPLGLAPPPRLASPLDFGLLPPAMPLVMGSGGNRGADIIPLGDGTRGRDSIIVHASGSPAGGLVGTDGGRGENAPGGLVQEGHFPHLPLEGQLEGHGTLSAGWVHVAPPLLMGPLGGGEDVGAGAAVVPAEPPRGSAPSGSAPVGPAPHVEGEHDGAAIPSLEDIAGWAPPFPGPAARVIVTPPAAAFHPRVVDGPDTPLTLAQVLAQGFNTSPPADIVATPPAAAPRPRGMGGPNMPLTFSQVLARGFGASAHAAGAATPPAAPVADISGPS